MKNKRVKQREAVADRLLLSYSYSRKPCFGLRFSRMGCVAGALLGAFVTA
jgi:hypothetical protein